MRGDRDVHTNYGVIRKEKLVDENIGSVIETHNGRKFFLIKPSVVDFHEKGRRGPQAVTLKDCALIAGYTGISTGSRVVEAGVGSGILSMFIANIIKPATLVSYEIREDFAKIAQENFNKFGFENIKIKMQDIYEGIDERNLDLVALDLPEPWRVVEHAKKALKVGGYISSYSPSIEQNKKFCDALRDDFMFETIEAILRTWDMEVVRPHSRMIGHTGFITFARLVKK